MTFSSKIIALHQNVVNCQHTLTVLTLRWRILPQDVSAMNDADDPMSLLTSILKDISEETIPKTAPKGSTKMS